ncbi:ComGF family competence protein [Bacillus sp. NEB1478]|uniref:ComGF family competence protein n=1 Tax=Bacillus sp. NEB1478 TaxID=3073816 RepID=UPI00287305AD|nr:ComGF family competence protein [Bacillus sp. NEB1478]WNB93560.1 ComGF family competence protein [Bacillus sp. NEB1478]
MKKNIKPVLPIFKTVKRENGTTLLEVIIALGVMLLLTSLIPLLLIPIQKAPSSSQLEDTILFFSMLGKEIREASSIEIQNDQLIITEDDGNVMSFSKYHSLIRKQINGLGHEVWLQNIRSLEVEILSEDFIVVKIQDLFDRQFDRVFRRINK